ncbi:MAG: hypothetical protein ABSG17_17950 [Spirochaetia bacterium]|jgi:hypothetical protein
MNPLQRRVDLVSGQGRAVPDRNAVNLGADEIVGRYDPEGGGVPVPDDGQPHAEAKAAVQNIEIMLQELDDASGPEADRIIGAIRAAVDQLRQYGDGQADADPQTREALDEYLSDVEGKLPDLPEPDEGGGEIDQAQTGVSKSLGEIAEEWFPELHQADAWGHPSQGAPGSGLAGFYAASKRTKKMRY